MNPDLKKILKDLRRKEANGKSNTGINLNIGDDGLLKVRGDDGYTPVKGVDYWTPEEINSIVDGIFKAAKPTKGVDYYTDADKRSFVAEVLKLATPVKGKDYRDGIDGKDGRDGVDGVSPDARSVAIDAVTLLESFDGDARLSATALRDFEVALDKALKNPDFKIALSTDQITGIKDLLPKYPPMNAGGSGATFLKSLRDVDLSALTKNADGKYILGGGGGSVDDTAYGVSWDGDTTTAPSKNAVYDKIETLPGGHDPVTVTDSAEIDFTLTGQDITADIKAGSIDETKLDTSVNASLDLADSAVQPGDLGALATKDTVATADIDNDAVTFDKIQNVATNRVLARSSTGTGSVEELTLPQFRTLINVEDGADVTDTANVTAAGALMDSEVTNLAAVKAFDPADYAPALGADDNYVTDAEKVVIGNTSGTNTGDEVILSGSGAPVSTPSFLGQRYIDTTADTYYVAVGTASSADWEVNGTGGGITWSTPVDADIIPDTDGAYDIGSTLNRFSRLWSDFVITNQLQVSATLDTGDSELEFRDGNSQTILLLESNTGEIRENYLTIKNSISGLHPSLEATGLDTNISINVVPKGTGEAQVNGQRIIDETDTNYVKLAAVTATAAELNTLDGITATTTELNYTDGVTSAIQTQLDAKASLTGTETLTNKTLTDAKVIGAINAQTGTTYTLVLADASKTVTMTNVSANTLTVPPNSSVAFAVGTRIFVTQGGAGSTTIAAGAGVTINAPTTVPLAIGEQHESRGLLKIATDTWTLI